jgi:chorismate-pyruvate lyase
VTVTTQRFTACNTAEEALASLCHGMRATPVTPDQLSLVAHRLLVHQGHMTEVLEAHHAGRARLTVLEDRLDNDVYWRKILLEIHGKLVEYGMVRIFLQYVPKHAAEEILARKIPLGRVLINHDVLRRVEPRWYVHVAAEELKKFFGIAPPTLSAFGRISIIHCNGQPAIELFEAVTT